MKIAVLGAGAFGSSLGGLLEEKGHKVIYYDPIKFPDNSLEDVLRFAKVILVAVPSEKISALVREFPEFGFSKSVIVASKGLLSLRDFRKFKQVEIISGPAFASQILDREKVKLTITGELTEALFKAGFIEFDKTDDELGVIFAGSLKNIFAVEAGFRKLEPETIEFEQFIFRALEEMESFLEMNGARRETARLACGEGDLRLTCSSEESRNYRFGVRLRSRFSGTPDETTEAINAVRGIEEEGLEVPRKAEILKSVIRRIKNAA
ncbi:hypothetical protein IJI70_00475 [Candidatus Saccharibacteria bacterium]|nr:hypothetical protein [Candidatus Saccharibacteria bacterium]